MDDTLIIISLTPLRMVTKHPRKSLRVQEKPGRHNVLGGNQKVSGDVNNARLCGTCRHTLGHMSYSDREDCSNISATNFIPSELSLSPAVP